jgi:hypothetical protein
VQGLLPDGFGVVKLVLDAGLVGSLRPYFHFRTPTCVSTTHEKGAPRPEVRRDRSYHWIFPIGEPATDEEA